MQALARFLFWPVLAGLALAGIILYSHPALYRGLAPSAAPDNGHPVIMTSFAPAVERAAPAVVNVYTRRVVPAKAGTQNPYKGVPGGSMTERDRVQQSLGSGVIVHPDGYILTNRHVIEGATDIIVLLHDGREFRAETIGDDRDTDLAVLRIRADRLTAMQPARLDQARVGDIVLAIGNPWGFGHSVSQGIISATGRYGLQLQRFENFIQTDAAINPGNSGGALVDVEGHLLGINTAIHSSTGGFEGIGLATPADTAMRVLDDIIHHGRVIRGWVGVQVQELTPDLARALGASFSEGLVVNRVATGSPAEAMGIHTGDLLVGLNGEPIHDGRQTMLDVAWRHPGDKVRFDVWHDGQIRTLELTLQAEPRPETAPATAQGSTAR